MSNNIPESLDFSGIIFPEAMDSVSVYPATITPVGASSGTSYAQVILLDPMLIQDSNVTGYTQYTTIAPDFDYWQLNSTKYRIFPASAQGGNGTEVIPSS